VEYCINRVFALIEHAGSKQKRSVHFMGIFSRLAEETITTVGNVPLFLQLDKIVVTISSSWLEKRGI